MSKRTLKPDQLFTHYTDAEVWSDVAACLMNAPLAVSVDYVSGSGMSRAIRVFGMSHDGVLRDISRHVARLTGYSWVEASRYQGVWVGGCGMDMLHHLMDSLGTAWAKHAGCEQPYRYGGRFANNGSRYDGDDSATPAPWPGNNARRNWYAL